MYNFVHYLSYTASVMILVVNCVERYVAIMCPFRAKVILRHRNLVAALVVVWLSGGVYCCPRLLYFRAGSHELPGAQYTEVICLADRELYDSKTFDTINFVLLYCMPLTVMSLLYWRIGSYLWINGRELEEARWVQGSSSAAPSVWKNGSVPQGSPPRPNPSPGTPPAAPPPLPSNHTPPCCIAGSHLKEEDHRRVVASLHQSEAGSSSSHGHCSMGGWRKWRPHLPKPPDGGLGPYHSERLIRTWRKVVKLLVAVVMCFAVCNLPFHLRKMLTYYHPGYNPTTDAALIFTPLSYLLMYLNSALNPIVYSFMSHNFRACVRDVLTRYSRKGRRRHPSGPRPPPPHGATVPVPPRVQFVPQLKRSATLPKRSPENAASEAHHGDEGVPPQPQPPKALNPVASASPD
ncbi:trissin receptor-like [Penaeus japonicus]|uniref:trissin receptor-like n=1 Tax=Penaeus japonicus TaxID=27405 RepID=UPI001C70FFCD|nr:trissin receptor-like [Penaeus japonicus]